MKLFNSYLSDKREQEIQEAKLISWLARGLKKFVAKVFSLKFGQKAVIRIKAPKNLTEDYLIEGGALAPLMGVYSEKVCAFHLCRLLEENDYDIARGALHRNQKDQREYKKRLEKVIELGKKGKPMTDPYNPKKKLNLKPAELAKVSGQWDAYYKMGLELAERTIKEITSGPDSHFIFYDVISAGQDGREDATDLIVEKWSENSSKMKKQYLFSLKAYLGDTTTNLEMQKDPMGFMLKVLYDEDPNSVSTSQKTINSLAPKVKDGVEVFSKSQKEWERVLKEAYGSDFEPAKRWAAALSKIVDWKNKEKIRIKKKYPEMGNNTAIELAKENVKLEESLNTAGLGMKQWQLSLWIEWFEIGIEKKGDKFKRAVLDVLELSKDSPVLITAGLSKKLGKVVTYRRSPSKDLKQLMSVDVKDLDIKVRGSNKNISGLEEFGIKEVMTSRIIIDLIDKRSGLTLYTVEGKLANSGLTVQWYSSVGEETKKVGRSFNAWN